MLETFGLLYRGYKENTVYWDSLILLRKAVLAIIATFAIPLRGSLQGLLSVAVLVLSLFTQTIFRPFKEELGNLNGLEATSLLISIITFLTGVIMDESITQYTPIQIPLASLVLLSNVGMILYLMFALLRAKAREMELARQESGKKSRF